MPSRFAGYRHLHQFDRAGPFAIAYAPPEQAQSDRMIRKSV
jgi:hypothetical protein